MRFQRVAAVSLIIAAVALLAVALVIDRPSADAEALPVVEYSIELAVTGPEGVGIVVVHLYAIDDATVPIEARMAEGRAAMLARFPGAVVVEHSEVSAAFKLFDTPVRWPQPSATWVYNPDGATQAMPAESSFAAIRDGATGWDNAGGSGFHFEFLSETATPTGCNGDTSTYGRDGLNVVGWGHIVGGHLGYSCHWRSASLVAGTPYFAIQEIDIIFEPLFAFSQQSLQALAMHEFGHALGLDHTEPPACPGKAMCAGVGAMQFIEPQQDDIFGVIALYGEALEPTPTPPVVPPGERPFRAIAPALSRD